MRILSCDDDFATWRSQARELLSEAVAPHEVSWEDAANRQLFAAEPVSSYASGNAAGRAKVRVPAELLQELESAACFRTPQRWDLLYRILWRVAQGERHARLAGDPDGSQLHKRLKSVSREAHHLHAFLRFHPAGGKQGLDYIGWYEPAHDILARASEHFIHRLGRQRWLIVTPVDGVWFDGEKLDYRKPCPAAWQALAEPVRGQDDQLWESYYSSIFNPARLNPTVMQGHMPSRFWKDLPEGKLIPRLISSARAGSQQNGQADGVVGRAGKQVKGRPRH